MRAGLVRRPIFYFILALVYLNGLYHRPVAAAEPPDLTTAKYKYNGPGSCAASACHGGVQPMPVSATRKGIWQNEYFIWASRDPHFGSFNSLQTPRSRRMAQILGLKNPPTSEPTCLVCHALAPSAEFKARNFEPEGVSCESCHGASERWFANHFEKQWSTDQSIQAGMYPIDDVVKRSERCLSCHLGTDDREVDHKMIAAGHPDLFFELDLFSAKQPHHWKEPPQWKDYANDSNYGVRLWAVGQAIQLREALNRLARRADRAQSADFQAHGGQWPEFSELDCFSCHHSVHSNWREPGYGNQNSGPIVNVPDSWRQQRGYGDRTIGAPAWNSAHYTLFRIVLKEVDPADSQDLESRLNDLYQATSKFSSSPKEVSDKAHSAGDLAAKVVDKMNIAFNKTQLQHLLEQISAQGDRIASQDTRSAEQAYMALDSLFRCYDGKITPGAPLNSGAYPAVGTAIDALYREFDDPSAYNAPRFAAGMRKVNAALRAAGI
jgi:hypothetical protein